jgi:hypothetical protein
VSAPAHHHVGVSMCIAALRYGRYVALHTAGQTVPVGLRAAQHPRYPARAQPPSFVSACRVCIEAIKIAREIFARLKNFINYRISATLQVPSRRVDFSGCVV